MKLISPFIFFPLFLLGSLVVAQNQKPSELFDAIVSLENTDLASGTEYIEQHIIRNNKHKYLNSERFEPGTITYGGQTFLNIPMKFNIFDDLLLINLIKTGGETTIQPYKQHIESFSLHGHNFMNLQLPKEQGSEIEGFYEVLHETSSGLLLKKHVKKILKHLDKSFTYYEFEPDDPQYVFFRNNTYYPLDSRRDLFKIFPDSEKMIRRYYRSNRSLSRSDHDQFLIQLFSNLPASN